MKKLVLATAALLCMVTAGAQKLVIGEKAPDLKISEWLWGKPADDGKPKLVEFFHPGSSQCTGRLGNISSLADKFKGRLNVIVISKEPASGLRDVTGGNSGTYFAATDEGTKSFDAFAVRFVPFSVLIDGKGRVLWFGNPTSLSVGDIDRLIK